MFAKQNIVDFEVGLDVIANAAGGQGESPITPKVIEGILKPEANNGKIKCVLMGHTHEGDIFDYKCLYINTGTWMDKLQFRPLKPCKPKQLKSRHLTVLVRTLAVPTNQRPGFEDTEPYAGGTFPDGKQRQANVTVNAYLFSLSSNPWQQLRMEAYDVASVPVG